MRAHALRPWQASLLTHTSVMLAFLCLTFFRLPEKEMIEVPVEVAEPLEVQNLAEAKEKPKVVLKSVNDAPPQATPTREVFGASRNSHTDKSAGADGVDAKKGNTLAKASDKEVLLDSDADALPTPTEEYLVSEMPSVLSEVRPVYPKEARAQELAGPVVMNILIDATGEVRQVEVVEGLEIFKQGAVEAMKKFRFKPAQVDGKPVAVRIRYTLRFELEY
ncbi:MAG TPA: TonB family protein [Bacteriovoracaceae bacterium]|nr:TonB family protein [Bacteriovoracaceae bacterium]